MVLVRVEQAADHGPVAKVHREAFGQDDEAHLVDELRRSPAFIPELSLVALQDGEVVGHVLFTRLPVREAGTAHAALALAPMAVLPRFQKRGIGSALVRAGLEAARRLGHGAVIVLGHPAYYPRFGFVPARPLGIRAPFDVPNEAFLALELRPGALAGVRGVADYPPEFGVGDARPLVLVFFSDAGGGHRNAATALLAAAEETGAPVRLEMVGLNDVLARWDLPRRVTGRSTEETYNELLRRGHTRYLVPLLRALHGASALLHRPLVRSAAHFLAERRPAAVVSVHPNFNRVLRDAVRQVLPGAPFIVALTDYADFPPHFWIEPGVDRVIVGSARAAGQALELGVPRERVTRTSGMILHPRFYRGGGPGARAAARAELGVPADAFLVTVLFGGKGAAEMEPLSRALVEAGHDWHVLAVCGKNPALFDKLAPLEAASGGRLHRLGFTDRVADWLAASDALAAKPGPGVLAEAFHQHVPVIVTCNRGTIPQERYNAQMITEQGLGLVVADWREIPAAARRLAGDAARRDAIRARFAALPPNRAVYEVLEAITAELRLPAAP